MLPSLQGPRELDVLLFSLFAGLAFPIQRQLVNDAITDSRFRATLLSIESIFNRLMSSPTAWVMGIFVAKGQITEFLNLTTIVTIVVITCLYVLIRRVRKRHSV